MLNAVVLAIEEKNQAGGVQGKKITLRIEDDRDEPERAIQLAQNMVDSNVLAVIGHYSSSTTRSALPTYTAANLPLLSPSVALSQIPGEGRTFFRVIHNNAVEAAAAAHWIKEQNFGNVAIVHNQSTYGKNLAEELQQKLPPSLNVQLLSDTKEDTETLMNRLPEVLFYAGGYQSAAAYLSNLRARDIHMPWIGPRTLKDRDLIRLLGADLAQSGQVVAPPNSKASETFEALYASRFGKPGPFAYSTYETLQALFAALESADPPPSKWTRAKAQKTLQAYLKNRKTATPVVYEVNQTEFVMTSPTSNLGLSAGEANGKQMMLKKQQLQQSLQSKAP